MLIWGTRLMGKTDVVPGKFYVATSFGHLYYVPLLPREGWVVLEKSGNEFRGVPIAISMKSVAFAWARTLVVVAAVIASIVAVAIVQERIGDSAIASVALAAGLWGVFWLITWSAYCTHASRERAYELAEHVGLNEAGMAHLRMLYGDVPSIRRSL